MHIPPSMFAPLAQLVEQLTLNQWVPGSNPWRCTNKSVFLTQRVHPYPFRTRKLSFAVPKILDWRRSGKIGHSRHQRDMLDRKCIPYFIFLLSSVGSADRDLYTKRLCIRIYKIAVWLWSNCSYSSLAQSVERVTVNHDVVGSSPTGGAKMSLKIIDFGAFFVPKWNSRRFSLQKTR